MSLSIQWAGLLVSLLLADSVAADRTAPPPLFATTEPLELKLVAPLDEIARDRNEEPEYFPATIELRNDAGEPALLDIKIGARGNFRRKRENCRFPPLRLNLRKKQVQGTVFAGQDKLKLVTHCKDRSSYTQYLLKEYIAYRILNRLTDASFRVRLLRIGYADTDKPERTETHYAFLLEHKSDLAKRLGAETVSLEKADRDRFDRSHAALALIFQYLLGNTDFSFTRGPPEAGCCHNAELLQRRADGLFLPVPYDFDYTGFVEPPYAEPPEQLRLRNIRERLYRGPCDGQAVMQAAFDRFQEARADIYALVRDQGGLEERVRKDLLRYVDDFYEVLDDPGERQEVFFARCE